MGCGCKNAEGGCGCGTKELNWESYDKPNYKPMMAESLHRMHSHCADCQCELNSKTHKMDTSASEGGAGGGHGALCDSCFVGGSKMRLDKKAEEPVVQEPDWIPAGDGRAIGQQDFAINLSPLHAEGEEEEEEWCVDCKTYVSAYDVVNAKGGDVCLPCWSNRGGEIIDDVAWSKEDLAYYPGKNYNKNSRAESSDYKTFLKDMNKRVKTGNASAVIIEGNVGENGLPKHSKIFQVGYKQDGFKPSRIQILPKQTVPRGYNNAESFNGETFGADERNIFGLADIYEKQARFLRPLVEKAIRNGCFDKTTSQEIMDKAQELNLQLVESDYFRGAESRFDKLSNEIANEYEEKGMSPEKAQEVGDATAAKIGRAKYGKTGMRNMQKKGMRADMVGNPSPTFNEDITGQDGPSADPTNQTFEAMRTLAPSSTDVTRARRDLKNSGYGDVIYDRYMVYRDGSSNKFYYTAVTEKDGKYYPMGAYGRIGYLSKLFNIYGKTEGPKASLSTMDAAYRQCSGKERAKIKKGYVDYTLQMAESFSSETLAEIEGPTAEATTGGLHAPSSFAMTWEDGTGQSSASIPPNEIAWAEETKGAETKIFGIGLGTLVVGALGIFGVKKLMDKKSDTASVDDTKKAEKGCGCSKTVAKSETVRKHSEYSADRINPVEVEGQNDIHNAESISLQQPNAGPQTAHRQSNRPSLKLW